MTAPDLRAFNPVLGSSAQASLKNLHIFEVNVMGVAKAGCLGGEDILPTGCIAAWAAIEIDSPLAQTAIGCADIEIPPEDGQTIM